MTERRLGSGWWLVVAWWRIALLSLVLVACANADQRKGGEDEALGVSTQALTFPGSLLREGDISSGGAGTVAADALEQLREGTTSDNNGDLQGGWFITARTHDNRYTVESWQLQEDGSIVNGGGLQIGINRNVTKLAVTGLGLYRFVVASIEDGMLQVRSFGVDSAGTVDLLRSFSGEGVLDLAMTRLAQADRDVMQVALVLRRADGTLKVFALNVTDTGTITARGSATGGSVGLVSIAALVQPVGVVVTPVTTSAGDLKVISWTANANGDMTRRSDVTIGSNVTWVSATAAGYQRVAFAYNWIDDDASEAMRVRTYEVSASGTLTALSSRATALSTRPKQHLSLVAGGGGRLFLSGRDRFNNLQVRSYDIANRNTIHDVDANSGGFVRGTAAVVLKGHRLVTATVASNGDMLAIAWRDYNVPVVRNFWPERFGTENVVPAPADSQTTFKFRPDLKRTLDLTIAASDRFVIVGAYNQVKFFDKAGGQLPEKHVGVPTTLFMSELFAPLFANTTIASATNYANLNRYLEFQHACDPSLETSELNRCTNDFYDSSVTYNTEFKRFIIQTQSRYHNGNAGDKTARYMLIAVSKTEDPRDGFYLYGNTESNVRDMPQLGTAAGMVIGTWNGDGDSYLRPKAFLYDLTDLAAGLTRPRVMRVTASDLDSGGGFLPINIAPSTAPAVAVLGRNRSDNVETWTFKKDFEPPLDASYEDIAWPQGLGADGHPHLPRSTIYISSVSGGVHSGVLFGGGLTGSVSRKPMLNEVRVDLDFSATPPVLSASTLLPTVTVFNCGTVAGYICRLPVPVVDQQGRAVLVYGREGSPVTSDPATWFGVRYRYNKGAEKLLAAGEIESDRGADMDFIEGARDPEGAGIWAVYKYTSLAKNGGDVIAGRIMP